jgi:hypothetical protein
MLEIPARQDFYTTIIEELLWSGKADRNHI